MPTSVSLPAVPVCFHFGVLEVAPDAVWRIHNSCRSLVSNRNEARGKRSAEDVDLNLPLEEGLLWGQTEDAGGLNEETFESSGSLVTAVGHSVPVSKAQFFEPGRDLADKVEKVRRDSVASTQLLSEQNEKIEELELKARLSIDASVSVSDLKKTIEFPGRPAWSFREVFRYLE